MVGSPAPYMHFYTCMSFKRLIVTALLIAPLFPLFARHVLAESQVWECAQGYTNNPAGKTNCEPAGGIETCGSDGNRYLSPRKIGERPHVASCKRENKGLSPIVDMRAAKNAQFGETWGYERLSAPVRTKKFEQSHPAPMAKSANSTLNDLFSCFSGDGQRGGCSIGDMQNFIEGTFKNISGALR